MMERIPFEPGRVVLSRQGRDEGRYFLVLSVTEDSYAYIADGVSHKLEHPKKKKFMHLKPKPVRMDELAERLGKPDFLNADLRKFLEGNGFGISKALCKED